MRYQLIIPLPEGENPLWIFLEESNYFIIAHEGFK
jgi:hypothetical protein